MTRKLADSFNAVNGMRSIAINEKNVKAAVAIRFNAVNGMRSIAINSSWMIRLVNTLFQCRKRHEVNCNFLKEVLYEGLQGFQCRKRHEVNCNGGSNTSTQLLQSFQCRKRHEVNCNRTNYGAHIRARSFNAVNGMRSIAI